MRTNAVGSVLMASVALATMGGCSSGGIQMAPRPSNQIPGLTNRAAQSQILQDPGIANIFARHKGIVFRNSVTTPSFMTPEALGKPLFFVSTTNVVDIYQSGSRQRMVGQITGVSPDGVATGNPVKVVDLVTPAFPIAFAFSASNADVYTAEQGGGGLANTYAFPTGGDAEKSVTVGGAPEAIAATPANIP
jgi:hypothetical protein